MSGSWLCRLCQLCRVVGYVGYVSFVGYGGMLAMVPCRLCRVVGYVSYVSLPAMVLCRILEKGELQISDKEREAKYASQFRDVANIVMEKTINPETQRPYTIGMIERFMREVHFAIDLNHSAKQQALDLIRLLEKRFPIARARMKLTLTTSEKEHMKVVDKLQAWGALIEKEERTGGQCVWVFQIDPGTFRACDAFCKECNGRLGVVSMAVQKEGVVGLEESEDFPSKKPAAQARLQGDPAAALDDRSIGKTIGSSREGLHEGPGGVAQLMGEGEAGAELAALRLSGHSSPAPQERKGSGGAAAGAAAAAAAGGGGGGRQVKCSTCAIQLSSASEYRDHCKSEWHRHNLKRKVKGLPPLSVEDCETDTDIVDEKNDLEEYCR
ncbi:hypothetical protein CBR_g48721 [Chara braunii]|uniref:C2H2-type domain-containing protein n=1 Tax=Chara braunii TaxID=69332 RepID=A0A388K4I2_CHABU|nr:hypothetical protein CBR_g48721 [Chara braunii]|eukprot:GBG64972.1 hypothetical protein CBR_g48721 [Chara braunii]